ncbi:MAG: alpha/beta hydrolase [Gammaproteobacteria bacterium]|nr:alpha/beta hydrolase [Gammaproteobacteria bacterium]MDP2142078.1 alpha/beta hydrolase [Gammaproteobacteria bacterium]MDP2347239.1 alpha/beta hydrolase [Gammaproteobacteria bacterium]
MKSSYEMNVDLAQKVLLLPGLDGTGRLFAPLQAALAGNLDTTAIAYGDERLLEDYVETVAANMADADTVLIAESFSGPVALALMSRFPSQIRCAVLCATFAVSPLRFLCGVAGMLPTWVFQASPLRGTLIRHFALNSEIHHDIVPEVMAVVRSVPDAVTKSRLKMLSRVDLRPLLSSIKHPVLCLRASDDRVVNNMLCRQLMDGLPNVDASTIRGPHMLAQTRPTECARAILLFLHGKKKDS